ncbi:hypothetical protein P170DRAFT_508748 [Aspergillus steynii IBT 23096]|uniref:Serine-threonine rich protein n=1 Tax=Aspergillus steynii IBT 23096 TaxID=1392250 RepID=A0A2I2GCH8_9EURO|nr:uncharacterized protein P170DRAFT_508748 [Aspergillus steynii IBT 23096]PLB50588.1 hypothetical protein P170DRAFT_508748 [Aspergillus steynii IBT 23096]
MMPNAKPSMLPLVLSKSARKGLHPTSKRLKTSLQTRKIWRGASQDHYHKREQRRMRIHRRFDLFTLWGRPAHPWPAQIYNRHPRWWKWERTWERPNPDMPEQKRGTYSQKHPWGEEGARMHKRIAQIRKEIETDPYGALFGRRLEPFSAFNKFEDTCASLYRSLFGLDKPESTGSTDTTARSKPFKNGSAENPETKASWPRGSGNEGGVGNVSQKSTSRYEFDPISGRMVPKKHRPADVVTEKRPASGGGSPNKPTKDPGQHTKSTGYLSSMNRTVIKPKAPSVDNVNSGVSPLEPKLEKSPENQIGSEQTSVASCKTDSGRPEPPREGNWLGNTTVTSEKETEDHGSPSEITSNADQTKNVEPRCPDSSKAASQHDLPSEELDLLQASDIRSRYASRKFEKASEMQDQMQNESNGVSNVSAYATSDIDAQNFRRRPEAHEQKQHLDTAASNSKTPSQTSSSDTTESQHSEKFNHAQPLCPSNSQYAEAYRVLAYDPSTLQIKRAEASTSLNRTNKSCHPSEVLSRLNNPAKFLPYFEEMHADGYEIASGGGDILVFRRSFEKPEYTGSSLKKLASEAQEIKAQLRNEPLLDEDSLRGPRSVSEQYQTHDANDGVSANLSRSPASDERFPRRSKTDSSEGKSTIGSAVRRMFFSGAATAATCYAIGVVVEYFRTGGEDGLGIDAFTEFESERRRRDKGWTG